MIDTAVRELHRPDSRAGRPAEAYLGPAEVVEVRAHEAIVRLPGGATARAALSLSLPYTPAEGDVLLVIERGREHHAIGVLRVSRALHGSPRTDLTFPGDVELRAVGGRLRLGGDRGVDVRGPEVSVHATTLRMMARDVKQTFASVSQRITALLRVHAAEAQTLVDGSATTQAGSAVIQTDETMTINGREVRLG